MRTIILAMLSPLLLYAAIMLGSSPGNARGVRSTPHLADHAIKVPHVAIPHTRKGK